MGVCFQLVPGQMGLAFPFDTCTLTDVRLSSNLVVALWFCLWFVSGFKILENNLENIISGREAFRIMTF